MSSVEDVRMLFPAELEELLTFEEEGKYIIVKPKRFLGTSNFAKVGSIVRGAGGEYFSAGKMSHFKVPKQTAHKGAPLPHDLKQQKVVDAIDLIEKGLTKLREAGY